MTIKATELLKLFTKAKQLDLSVEVCEDKDAWVVGKYALEFLNAIFDIEKREEDEV